MKLDKTTLRRLMFLITFAVILFVLAENAGKAVSAVGYVLGMFTPLVLGFAIAFVLNVPLCFIEKHFFPEKSKTAQKLKRPVSILVSVLVIAAIIAAVLLLVIPELVKAVRVMIELVPDFAEKAKLKAEDIYNSYPEVKKITDSFVGNSGDISATVADIAKKSVGGLVGSTFGMIGSVFGGIVDTVVGFIFALYILANKEKLRSQVQRLLRAWLPRKHSSKIFHVCSVANRVFRKFVVGQFTEAMILGMLCMLGMLLFRFPYAGMIGALVGITALIPIVGGLIGAGVGAFMIMMQDPIKAVFFLIFIVVLQQIEGNLIYPRVVGSSVGLPPMWVLAAVTVGGGFMGILGMLLAVPAASTVYFLVREDVNKRNFRKAKRSGEDSGEEQAEVNVISHEENQKAAGKN